MDYEKKYKEAQKWIESIYSELSHEQQMEAEAFFPELKESEDEKMMHQLHSWMKEFGDVDITVNPDAPWFDVITINDERWQADLDYQHLGIPKEETYRQLHYDKPF